jgi:hypothetical protein
MTTATARRDELASELAATKQEHAAASAALGRAVAENRDSARLRREAHDLQVRVGELEAALPAAEQMIREEEAAAAARAAAEEAARREEHRKKREAAARRFDEAIALAGVAFDEWHAAFPEGSWKVRLRNALPLGLAVALGHNAHWDEMAPLAKGDAR